ncbi:MAG: YbjQ family protein [Bacteroidales bacterium]|nr:YbjQ family protein [Bacteroidales bacterium]MCF8457083.1 YbjQ family protein [Bacteroidales bacterium]
MKAQNVKVTTTSGFDGVDIEEYLEPITAHVVIGMNFFKDFLSGFSDFFGGKSRTYQNTLSSINDEVINELRKKAYSIGGNCILGLKIDNDEVSAQGKSMMMVTALGTAAKANFTKKSMTSPDVIKADRISNELFNYYKQKKRYLIESEKESLIINDELWDFVKSNRVSELAMYLLDGYLEFVESCQEYQKEDLNKFSNHLSEYFLIIDTDIAINCLYDRLLEEEISLRKKIIEKIYELQLIDFDRIIGFLKGQDFHIQKSGLQLLKAEKLSYEKSDIQQIENIINLVSSTFNERGEKSTKKKALSSKEKEIWICECGKENDIDKKYCSACQKDIYGFSEKEVSPIEITEKLIDELEILKATIG